MNTKNDCWLCGRGYGLDNGNLVPGEMKQNMFGDMECVSCTERLNFTVLLLEHPEITQSLNAIGKAGFVVIVGADKLMPLPEDE